MNFQKLKEALVVLEVLVNNFKTMNILQIFFWFCKEHRIMDLMIKMYRQKKLGIWRYDTFKGTFFEHMSLGDFLSYRVKNFGFKDMFWSLQPIFSDVAKSEKYKKARSKWNAFCKNNIMYSDEFIKVGDKVEVFGSWGPIYSGTVVSFPKDFSGCFQIKTINNEELSATAIGNFTIKVNDVVKTPEFYIKKRKKIYGANKK